MDTVPKISVIMACSNEVAFVRASLESILRQDYADLEIIIVDDCSTDASAQIIMDVASREKRVRFIQNEKRMGLTASLIKAINYARGEYVARQDADDCSMPERLGKQVRYLESNPNVVLLGTMRYEMDDQSRFIKKPFGVHSARSISRLLRHGNVFTHGAVMFRKDAYNVVGGYDSRFKYAQDYDLWLRLSKVGAVHNLKDRLYCRRVNAGSISGARGGEQSIYAALGALKQAEIYDERIIDAYIDRMASATDADDMMDAFHRFLKGINSRQVWLFVAGVFMRCGQREQASICWEASGAVTAKIQLILVKFVWGFYIVKFVNRLKACR